MNLFSLAEASTESFRREDGIIISAKAKSERSGLESFYSNADRSRGNIKPPEPAHSNNMFASVGGTNRVKLGDKDVRSISAPKPAILHAPHPSSSFDTASNVDASFDSTSSKLMHNMHGNSIKHTRKLDFTSHLTAANVEAAINASKESLNAAEVTAAGISGGLNNSVSQSTAGGSKAVLAALKALQDKIRRLETERDAAREECVHLNGQVQAKTVELSTAAQRAQSEKEQLNQDKKIAVAEAESKWLQETEKSRSLQNELRTCGELQQQLSSKISDQVTQISDLRARLDEAIGEKQHLKAKEQEVAQTIVWESRRHEDEKEQVNKQLRAQQQELMRVRYECEISASRIKELEATIQSLKSTKSRSRSFDEHPTLTTATNEKHSHNGGQSLETGSVLSSTFDDSDSVNSDFVQKKKKVKAKTAKSADKPSKLTEPKPNPSKTTAKSDTTSLPPKIPPKISTKDLSKDNRQKSKEAIQTSARASTSTTTRHDRANGSTSYRKRADTEGSILSMDGENSKRRARSDSVDSRLSVDSMASSASTATNEVPLISRTHGSGKASSAELLVANSGPSRERSSSIQHNDSGIAYAQNISEQAALSNAREQTQMKIPERGGHSHGSGHGHASPPEHAPHHALKNLSEPTSDHTHAHRHTLIADSQIPAKAPTPVQQLTSPQFADDAEVAAYNAMPHPHSTTENSELSGIAQMDESIDVVRAIYGHEAVLRNNNETLADLQSSLKDARAAQKTVEYAGLGARPRVVLQGHVDNIAAEQSFRAARAAAAEKELGGTFGSPTRLSAVNSALLQKHSPLNFDANGGLADARTLSSAGIHRGNTLNSVIASLEEEFNALNNQYRKRLSACSSAASIVGKHSEEETRDADELVQIIHKLHRKGEQLRKLRVGSPSMNLFSSNASAAYVNNMANTNLSTSISLSSPGGQGDTVSSLNQLKIGSKMSSVPHFVNPLPATPGTHRFSGQIKDDVLDFEVQALNATSGSPDSLSMRY